MSEEQKMEAPAKAEEAKAPAKKPGRKTKAEAKRKIVTVDKGMARTSVKGVLTHGDEVTEACFRGGKATFDKLKKNGVLVDAEV